MIERNDGGIVVVQSEHKFCIITMHGDNDSPNPSLGCKDTVKATASHFAQSIRGITAAKHMSRCHWEKSVIGSVLRQRLSYYASTLTSWTTISMSITHFILHHERLFS